MFPQKICNWLTFPKKKKIAFPQTFTQKHTTRQTHDYPEICQLLCSFATFVFAMNCPIICPVLDRYYASTLSENGLFAKFILLFSALLTKLNVGIFPRTIPSRTAKNGVVSDYRRLLRHIASAVCLVYFPLTMVLEKKIAPVRSNATMC